MIELPTSGCSPAVVMAVIEPLPLTMPKVSATGA